MLERDESVGPKKKTNAEVLEVMQERRDLLKGMENRRGGMFGHMVRHDSLLRRQDRTKKRQGSFPHLDDAI